MPRTGNINDLSSKAKDLENMFKWFEAAKAHEESLSLKAQKESYLAETYRKIGFCYERASLQASSFSEFKRIRQMAVDAYRKAAQTFDGGNDLKSQGEAAYCRASAEYVGSWLASSTSEKKKMFEKCCKLGKKSLEAFEAAGDKLSYGRMCNDLLPCLLESFYIASNLEEQNRIGKAGVDTIQKAIHALSSFKDESEIVRTYFAGSLQTSYAANASRDELKRKELAQKSLDYAKKALKLAETVKNAYYAAMSNAAASYSTLFFTRDTKSSYGYAEKMLEYAEITGDNYVKGFANYLLAFSLNWMALGEEDPKEKAKAYRKIIKHAEDAIDSLKLVGHDFFIAEVYLFYAESYSSRAVNVETTVKQKLSSLKKAMEIGRKGLTHAKLSGSSDAKGAALHALSKALHSYSNMEKRRSEKTKLLAEALSHRKEYIRVVEEAFTFDDWLLGVGKCYEGLVKAELAEVEKDEEKKTRLLRSVALDLERGISHCRRSVASLSIPARLVATGRFEDRYGEVLNELYSLTGTRDYLQKAQKVYGEAARGFEEAKMPSRVAESYWKTAKIQDELGDYLEAATHFDLASKAYQSSAIKIPQLEGFFTDHASYMKAWKAIEKAKNSHTRHKFGEAEKLYEEAANLHAGSKSWSYLTPNYSAWAQLERGEDLSQNELSGDSKSAFAKAAELFSDAKRTIQSELGRIENSDETGLAHRLINASEARREYCLGRVCVEEAKILDKQGNHIASSDQFGLGAEIFWKMSRKGSEQTHKEMQPLILLCKAWQTMVLAEAKVSPIMYGEAAKLFQQAKNLATDQPTSLLAQANSSFCIALKAGTEYEISRERSLHLTAAQHLENAANYYLKAGLAAASEYAKATQRLFDAYVYIDMGKKERDPERKVRYYVMAEKVLQTSANSYEKAKHPEKSTQVQGLLQRVREERDLATSLSEVLHAPAGTTSTGSFATLVPSEEEAVGLESFKHANVQSNLVLHAEEAIVGEDFELELQIVNVGKEAVLLTKVEDLLPKGFQIVSKPEYCSQREDYIDMRGRLLNPLQTEDVSLVLRPFEKGVFEFKPKLLYVGETGRKMSSAPESNAIKIRKIVLPGRLKTGFRDLDILLLGGIPHNYAVILTSPSCDEKDQLVRSYLTTGATQNETALYVTTSTATANSLAEEFPSDFYLFVCSPQTGSTVKLPPNMVQVKGVENLNAINMALISRLRSLETSEKAKRACIEIVSDVLLQHHAIDTRRWLNSLIPELKSKGFTTLVVLNPHMHPPEEVEAVLGLFEGEINIYEKETKKRPQRFLRIRKMYNQKYLESELLQKGNK